ncbi:LysR substrate-binding domain-containing protein [Kiloniella spongiae]|uniref:LysR substrate-binding domain-containing protein n=1 Tax=Kiloniella spongiae TaxID=1489064 RepID=UPI000699763A|nr:LysR substrate-binding domain-containing protein [Kiloniella spongiae]
MDIKLLRTLIAFSETGSCQGAADVVNKTQAAVSVHLKQLELAVGKPLFKKEGRQLRLNTNGHNLVSYAHRIVRLHNEALAAFKTTSFTGTLRVGLPDDYISTLLDPLLHAFDNALPSAQIELRCEPSANLRSSLANGELDAAILSSETDTKEGQVLRQEGTHWIAPKGYDHKTSDNLKLLLFPEGCILRKWALNALKMRNIKYEIVCTSYNMQALKTAMSHGLGVMVATESNMPEGSMSLSENMGLPALPDVTIMLVAGSNAKRHAVEQLYQTIQQHIGWKI